MKNQKTPIIVGQVRTLTANARELLAEVKIFRSRTIGKAVYITQHGALGTSFEFCDCEHGKEYHIPARMVNEVFA